MTVGSLSHVTSAIDRWGGRAAGSAEYLALGIAHVVVIIRTTSIVQQHGHFELQNIRVTGGGSDIARMYDAVK